jgi:hypothetical protein
MKNELTLDSSSEPSEYLFSRSLWHPIAPPGTNYMVYCSQSSAACASSIHTLGIGTAMANKYTYTRRCNLGVTTDAQKSSNYFSGCPDRLARHRDGDSFPPLFSEVAFAWIDHRG